MNTLSRLLIAAIVAGISLAINLRGGTSELRDAYIAGMFLGTGFLFLLVFATLGKLFPEKPNQVCGDCRKTRSWAAEPLNCSCGGMYRAIPASVGWWILGIGLSVLLFIGFVRVLSEEPRPRSRSTLAAADTSVVPVEPTAQQAAPTATQRVYPDRPSWIRVDLERFSVELPGVPEDKQDQQLNGLLRTLSVPMNGRVFHAAAFMYHVGEGAADLEGTLRDNRDSKLRGRVGTLVYDRHITVSGLPGREYSIRSYNPDNVCVIKSWMSPSPIILYTLQYCSDPAFQGGEEGEAKRFLESIRPRAGERGPSPANQPRGQQPTPTPTETVRRAPRTSCDDAQDFNECVRRLAMGRSIADLP